MDAMNFRRGVETEIIDRHVAERIRKRRVALGFNQAGLADRLGVSLAQMQRYESGTSRLTPGRLQLLATELNVPVGFFFEDLNGLESRDYSGDVEAGRLTLELVRAFNGLGNSDQRNALLALAKSMQPAAAPAGKMTRSGNPFVRFSGKKKPDDMHAGNASDGHDASRGEVVSRANESPSKRPKKTDRLNGYAVHTTPVEA